MRLGRPEALNRPPRNCAIPFLQNRYISFIFILRSDLWGNGHMIAQATIPQLSTKMNQLRRAPMVPDIGRAADQNEEMTQAGRASSSLGAERNSAELRSQRSSSPTTITGTNPSVRSQSSSDMLAIGRRPSATSLNRRASYAPAIPSPLNPSSSRTSFNSTCEDLTSDDVTPTDSESSSEAARRQSAGGTKSKRNLNLSPSQLLLRQNSAINMRPDEMPRSETPRMLKDLGRDYSRYPSSNNISQCPSSNNISRLSSSFPGKRPSYQSSQMALQRTTTKNPFNDSQSDLENWGYPDDSIGTFDPYFGGEKGFILYSDQVEEDDKLHMPMDDDNITFRPKLSDYLDRRSVLSAIGGIFLCLGLLCVFIILPVLTFQTHCKPLSSTLPSGGSPSRGRIFRDPLLTNF